MNERLPDMTPNRMLLDISISQKQNKWGGGHQKYFLKQEVDHPKQSSDGVMAFNATFNNISANSWRSVLLVEETRVP